MAAARFRRVRLAVFVCIILLLCLYLWIHHGLFQVPVSVKGAASMDRHYAPKTNEKEAVVPAAPNSDAQRKPQPSTIHLATVACDSRVGQGMVMLKSAALLTATTSESHLVFHVFSEATNHRLFSGMLESWPPEIRTRVSLSLYTGEVPRIQGWVNPYFRECSTLRLFFHILLPDVDAVLYLDSDILVLYSLDHLWNIFSKMSPSHLMALSAESEDPTGGWYHTRASIPFVNSSGLNSGVLLMNLTRLRHSNWTRTIVRYSQEYNGKLTLGDQDVMNVHFHFHPDEFYWLNCSTNYRKDHCSIPSCNPCHCRNAENGGAYILHGNDFGFDMIEGFKVTHSAFGEFKMGDDLGGLLDKVRHNLKGGADPCSRLADRYLQRLTKAVDQWRRRRARATRL